MISLRVFLTAGCLLGVSMSGHTAGRAAVPSLSKAAIEKAELARPLREASAFDPVVARAQIMLDRAHVSPGVIDGRYGGNTKKALRAFQFTRGMKVTGVLDQGAWDALAKVSDGPALRTHEITASEVKGPFTDQIPDDFVAKAKLERLGYTSPLEKLAEQYHTTPDLLQRLNPGKPLDKAGTKLLVPNVRDNPPAGKVVQVIVNKHNKSVKGVDDQGDVVVFYPATIGSEDNPAPSGRYEVTRVSRDPDYHYSPSLAFAGVDTNEPLTLPPGANNPIGLVWIDLSKENYGIHGTPEPALISKTSSHGCIRLTNWDALELADLVKKGTAVIFKG